MGVSVAKMAMTMGHSRSWESVRRSHDLAIEVR